MKTQWNFYLSGILYGKIYEEQETKTVSLLDVYTGKWGQEKPFTQEESLFFQKLCSRDLLEFFEEKVSMKKILEKPRQNLLRIKGKRLPAAGEKVISSGTGSSPRTFSLTGKGSMLCS